MIAVSAKLKSSSFDFKGSHKIRQTRKKTHICVGDLVILLGLEQFYKKAHNSSPFAYGVVIEIEENGDFSAFWFDIEKYVETSTFNDVVLIDSEVLKDLTVQ